MKPIRIYKGVEISAEALELFRELTSIAEDTHHLDKVAMIPDRLKKLNRELVNSCNEKLVEFQSELTPLETPSR